MLTIFMTDDVDNLSYKFYCAENNKKYIISAYHTQGEMRILLEHLKNFQYTEELDLFMTLLSKSESSYNSLEYINAIIEIIKYNFSFLSMDNIKKLIKELNYFDFSLKTGPKIIEINFKYLTYKLYLGKNIHENILKFFDILETLKQIKTLDELGG